MSSRGISRGCDGPCLYAIRSGVVNCVVICCDTFRYDMINHSVVNVPNLDRIVREGTLFTNAFAEGPSKIVPF